MKNEQSSKKKILIRILVYACVISPIALALSFGFIKKNPDVTEKKKEQPYHISVLGSKNTSFDQEEDFDHGNINSNNKPKFHIFPNPNFKKSDYLTNYWPFQGNVRDMIGGADLYGGVDFTFESDRFTNPQSSLNLKKGYLYLPSGRYLNSKSTFMAWIKVTTPGKKFVIFEVGTYNTITLIANTFRKSETENLVKQFENELSININLNAWSHLTAVFENNQARIYLNSVLMSLVIPFEVYDNVFRTSNYIGRGNNGNNFDNFNGEIDEMKIFNKSLSLREIFAEMNNDM